MPVNTIWVVAEPASGGITTTSFRALDCRARPCQRGRRDQLGTCDRVETPRCSASTARRRSTTSGTARWRSLPGVPVAAAIATLAGLGRP